MRKIENEYKIKEDIIEIYTKNGTIIIDLDMESLLKEYRFSIGLRGYATTSVRHKHIYLHHLILGKKEGFVTDHINRNKLDNKKQNLRFVTRSFNNQNVLSKGYWYDKTRNNYQTYSVLNGKRKFLGRFKEESEAKLAVYNFRRKYLPFLV